MINKTKLMFFLGLFLLCACKEEASKSNEVIADQAKKTSAKPQAPIHKRPVLERSKWDPDQWPKCGSLKSCNREFLYLETEDYIFKIRPADRVRSIGENRYLNCETEKLSCEEDTIKRHAFSSSMRFGHVYKIGISNSSVNKSTYDFSYFSISDRGGRRHVPSETLPNGIIKYERKSKRTLYVIPRDFFTDAQGNPVMISCTESAIPSYRCSTKYYILPNLFLSFDLSDDNFLRDLKTVNKYIHSMIYKEKDQ